MEWGEERANKRAFNCAANTQFRKSNLPLVVCSLRIERSTRMKKDIDSWQGFFVVSVRLTDMGHSEI